MTLLFEGTSLIFTISAFMLCKRLYTKLNIVLLSPILICPLLLIGFLFVSHIPYGNFDQGTKILTRLLGPATVAFAVPMYKHFHLLRKHKGEILTSLTIGSIVAIISSFFFACYLHLNPMIIESMIPRSITTPVAIEISKTIGGVPTLTAIFVIITGLTGTVIGPFLIKLLRIRSGTAKGLMLGMGAHGAGTSKAFEFGEKEGTFASLSMIIASGITLLLVHLLYPALRHML